MPSWLPVTRGPRPLTHLVSKAASPGSSRGTSHEKALLLGPLGPRVAQLWLPRWPAGRRATWGRWARGGRAWAGLVMVLGLGTMAGGGLEVLWGGRRECQRVGRIWWACLCDGSGMGMGGAEGALCLGLG